MKDLSGHDIGINFLNYSNLVNHPFTKWPFLFPFSIKKYVLYFFILQMNCVSLKIDQIPK